MKAAVYYETGPPSVFRTRMCPDPTCAPDGVVIDVQAVSIEGGDVLNRAGGDMPNKPHIVGYQCAGVDPRDRSERDGPICRAARRGSDAARLACRARRCWRDRDVAGAGRARH